MGDVVNVRAFCEWQQASVAPDHDTWVEYVHLGLVREAGNLCADFGVLLLDDGDDPSDHSWLACLAKSLRDLTWHWSEMHRVSDLDYAETLAQLNGNQVPDLDPGTLALRVAHFSVQAVNIEDPGTRQSCLASAMLFVLALADEVDVDLAEVLGLPIQALGD